MKKFIKMFSKMFYLKILLNICIYNKKFKNKNKKLIYKYIIECYKVKSIYSYHIIII